MGGGRDVVDAPKFAAYGFDEHAGTYESPEPDPDITATNWIWSAKDKVKRWDRTAFFVDKTLDFLKRHAGHPAFINVWLDDVHTPWVPDEAAQDNKPAAQTPERLQKVIAEMDRQIGRLLDGIDKLGISQQTLVIFASDNGALPTLKGQRLAGLRGSKLSLYEGGIRLPFIAHWPGHVPAGRVDESTVIAAVDLLPTFCGLAGAALPTEVSLDGEDQTTPFLVNQRREQSRCSGNMAAIINRLPFRPAAIAARTSPCAKPTGSCWSIPMAAGRSCMMSSRTARSRATFQPSIRKSPNE